MSRPPASRTWALRCQLADALFKLANRIADSEERRIGAHHTASSITYYEAARDRRR